MVRNNLVLMNLVNVMKLCRHQLVDDVLNQNPNLYKYLLESNSDTRRHRKKLYELQWLEMHWQECKSRINRTNYELATRRELMKIFLGYYWEFLKSWGYAPSDALFLSSKIQAFDRLIRTEENLRDFSNKLQTDLMIEENRLRKLIEEMENR